MIVETSWQNELRKGLVCSREGRFDHALQNFRRAHELAPQRPETACALGREHMRRGEPVSACELLHSAWERDHTFISAGTSLARCLGLSLRRFDDAYRVLDQIDEIRNDSMSRIIRSELLLAEGRFEEAASVAQSLRSLPAFQSENQETLRQCTNLLMARVENARGMAAAHSCCELAIFAFKRAHDLDPNWAPPLSNLGAAFEKLGKWHRAELAYRNAVDLDPLYGSAWHNLAHLYQKRSDSRVEKCFAQAYLAAPTNLLYVADYAIVLYAGGAIEESYAILHQHAHNLTAKPDRDGTPLAEALSHRGAPQLSKQYLRYVRMVTAYSN